MRNPMRKKTLDDVDVTGKRVLVRVDFNVPLEGDRITDDTRIRAALPTIRRLIDAKARVVLMSHLGRPDGEVKDDLRLAPVAERLAQLLGRPVATAPDCTGPQAQEAVAALKEGDVLLLGQEDKMIDKKGNYLYYGEIGLGNGWDKAKEYLRRH